MEQSKVIKEIDKLGLCLGCGLCESICGKDAVEMQKGEDGFFHPFVKSIDPDKEKIIEKICPGTNVVNDINFGKEESVWGHIEELWSGYSTDNEIRTRGSSGGIVSGIATYLLENNYVDGILQVGGDNNDYERNTLKVSYNKDDVLKCASSRYAPALIFDNIFKILDENDKVFCFIGKPCDISALKNFLNEYSKYKDRFKLTISIICAGMPSVIGTSSLINEFKPKYPIRDLVYRGNGWPGYFSFSDSDNVRYKKSYNESWGKTLNKHLKLRCKLCPDGVGIQADIAVGDAWETKDGYPDFSEKEGQSLIISRTKLGSNILQNAKTDLFISLDDLDINKIQLMQPYQFNRRTRVGARVLAFLLTKKYKLNYINMNIYRNLLKVNPFSLIKEFIGAWRRF